MLGERRRHNRHSINRMAKFVTDSGALPRDCLIVNLSESGARLFSEAEDIPDNFILLVSGDAPVRQECRVVLRLGGEIGVAFVTKQREQFRTAAMKELRSQVRDVFRQES
jgi:PilZ domain